jgi:hypothetical protein
MMEVISHLKGTSAQWYSRYQNQTKRRKASLDKLT